MKYLTFFANSEQNKNTKIEISYSAAFTSLVIEIYDQSF